MTGWPLAGTVTRRGAGCLPLAFGPRRRRRALNPVAGRTGSAPQRQRWRGGCKRSHPSGARILKPCVLAVKIARCARVAARSLRASGPLRRRDSGAPIGAMARSERYPTL